MTRYIPENAKEIKKAGVDAVAYTYESSGALYALAFSGRRSTAAFHYRYSTEQHRAQAIEKFFAGVEAHARYKQEHKLRQKELKAEFLAKIEVGSIFVTCWGYDQTNVEWYEITGVKGSMVRLRRIAAQTTGTGYLCGTTTPVKGAFIGEELKRVVRGTGIRIDDVITAYPSDGRPQHYSSTY